MLDTTALPTARLRAVTPSSGPKDEDEPLETETQAGPALVTTLTDLPLMLTVTETASVLRISRATAYKLIEANRVSRGATGLVHVRFGSRILIRRSDLARLVGADDLG